MSIKQLRQFFYQVKDPVFGKSFFSFTTSTQEWDKILQGIFGSMTMDEVKFPRSVPLCGNPPSLPTPALHVLSVEVRATSNNADCMLLSKFPCLLTQIWFFFISIIIGLVFYNSIFYSAGLHATRGSRVHYHFGYNSDYLAPHGIIKP